MEKEAVAKAIVTVLDGFAWRTDTIETAVHISDGLIGIETTDGDRYFVEVQDV